MSSSEKTARLLKQLAAHPYEFRLTELAEAISCVKSGAHKLLGVLMAEGLVEQTPDKKYRLGVGAYLIGKSYEENLGAWRPFMPYLERLRNATRENASFGTWLNGEPTILYRLESPESIRIMGHTGIRPLNASAASMALAAYADPEWIREKIAAKPLQRITPLAIVDVDELFEEYAKIRERGYSISNGIYKEDALGIGMPIWDKQGRVWAAISMSAPLFRVTEEKIRKYVSIMMETASQLSQM